MARRRKRVNPKRTQRILMAFILAVMVFIFITTYDPGDLVLGPVDGDIWVHFIDVGQGDSVLVHSAEHAVLIDAGPVAATQNVVRHIENLGISVLDYVVATHPHSDHIGGLIGVLDRFEVRELWMPDVLHDTATFENFLDAVERNNISISTVQAGDLMSAGVIQMTAVAPVRSGYPNLNDYSIVLRMVYGITSFLFTGDAEAASENDMVASGRNLQANVLQAGHHGSRTSSTEAFLDAVAPAAVVIQVGAGNQFNHPHPEVLERFAQRGIEVLRTDEWGTITLATDGEDIHIYD